MPRRRMVGPEAALVRQVRLSYGLSQVAAAAVVGSSNKAWNAWERGFRKMPGQTWELFCIKASMGPVRVGWLALALVEVYRVTEEEAARRIEGLSKLERAEVEGHPSIVAVTARLRARELDVLMGKKR